MVTVSLSNTLINLTTFFFCCKYMNKSNTMKYWRAPGLPAFSFVSVGVVVSRCRTPGKDISSFFMNGACSLWSWSHGNECSTQDCSVQARRLSTFPENVSSSNLWHVVSHLHITITWHWLPPRTEIHSSSTLQCKSTKPSWVVDNVLVPISQIRNLKPKRLGPFHKVIQVQERKTQTL